MARGLTTWAKGVTTQVRGWTTQVRGVNKSQLVEVVQLLVAHVSLKDGI